MDGIAADLVFEDTSALTTDRKRARSGRIEVLVRADRRRSWTPDQKCQIVLESVEPGVLAADVARRHGIGTGLLYTWRRQMVGLQRAVTTQPGPRFASVDVSPARLPPDPEPVTVSPVSAPPPPPLRAEGLIEIILPGGVSVRVDAHVDGRALRRVLGALEG